MKDNMKIGIIGLGYVGSAALEAFKETNDVIFSDPRRADSSSMSDIAECDVVFVCVPTPSDQFGRCDLSIVRETLEEISRFGYPTNVVIKSTVAPGSTDHLALMLPNLRLCFVPEFLRELHSVADFANPARVILGWTASNDDTSKTTVRRFFRAQFPNVIITETTAIEAEFAKYASNAFFAVKVSFANEMAELGSVLGVDWDRVRHVLSMDPRIGTDHLRVPGHDGHRGYGGACLPKDVAAILAVAQDACVELPVIAAADASNKKRRA